MEFDWKEVGKEGLLVLFASVILTATFALCSSFTNQYLFLLLLFFVLIILVNIATKKISAYFFESDIKIKLWEVYQYWLTKKSHFNRALPMIWLPPVLAFLSKGFIAWMPVLEFDITPRVERVTRRHGLYRFSEMTEWHVALISAMGIAANLAFAVLAYIISVWVPGLEELARLNVYYAVWSLLPISSLDGSKILFGSKILWFALGVICLIFLAFALVP
jgi:hypothetical protein